MKENTNCMSCQNTECFVRQFCSPEWLQKIDKRKFQTAYKQGQNIIHEGFPALGIYIIQKGKAKIVLNGFGGRQQVTRFANSGQMLGYKMDSNNLNPTSIVTMEDSQICFIENIFLHEILMNNPNFTIALMTYYSQELINMEIRIKNLAQMTIREKVADSLLLLNDHFGINCSNEINVHFSRKDIANIAGTTSEQVVRQFSEFEETNLISKNGRKITIINIVALRKIVSYHYQNAV